MRYSCMTTFFRCFLLFGILILAPTTGISQEYTVGTGDVLDINVYENEDLSTTVRVSSNSMIRVPLIGEISVKNLTVSKISAKIERLFADGYLVNPQVDVFISEHRSKQAHIYGEIKKPGPQELRGKITLLEFISKSGGLTENAGRTAVITRVSPVNGQTQEITIDLDQLIKKGDSSLNTSIEDNDSIYISRAEIYYVSGEVNKPNSYKYEPNLTVIKAITKAGGFSKIASRKKVKIIRVIEGEERIFYNVKMDTPVLPDDVIVVPESFF